MQLIILFCIGYFLTFKETEMIWKFLSTTNTTEAYWYSDAMVLHMPKDTQETYKYTLVYSRKKVILQTDQDRRLHNSSNFTDKLMKTYAEFPWGICPIWDSWTTQ